MKASVSCRAASSLIKYARSRGLNISTLLEHCPFSEDYLTQIYNWVPEDISNALFERAAQLLHEEDLAYKVGLSTLTGRVLGGAEVIARLMSSPRRVYQEISGLPFYFDERAKITVQFTGRNSALITMHHPMEDPKSRYICQYARGLAASVPTLWDLPPALLREKQCILSVERAGPLKGKSYRVDPEGTVFQSVDDGKQEQAIGKLSSTGTFEINGVVYGADACVYEVSWGERLPWYKRLVPFLKKRTTSPINERNLREEALFEIARDKQLIQKMHEMEETLRGSEKNLKTILENAPDGVYLSDLQGKFLYGNKKAEEIVGYKKEELIDKNFLQLNLLPQEKLATAAKLLALNAAGKNTGPDEFELIRKDGSRAVTEITTTPIKQREKTVVIGFVRDVTERKKAEEVLRESERRYRLLAEKVTDVIWTMDMDLRITYISPSVTRLAGFSVEEAVGLTVEEFLTPASLEVARKTFEEESPIKRMEQEDPFRSRTLELEVIRKDGSTVWTENTMSFLRDPDGRPIGIVGVTRDITERKKAAEVLRESEKQYRILFQSMLDGMFVIDAETLKIVLANEALAKMYGFDSAEDIIGLNPLDFIPPEDREEVARIIAEDMFEKDLRQMDELRTIARDGREIWVNTLGTRIEYQGRLAGLVSIRDITERKRAEEALRESERRYRLLAENVTDVITSVDMNLRPTYMSPSITRLLGYSVEEAMARGLEVSLTPASTEVVMQALATELALEHDKQKDQFRPRVRELEFYHKDGSTVWVEVKVSFLRNSEGQPVEIISVLRDVTDRKKAEEQIQYQANLLANVNDAVIAWDKHFLLSLWNPAAERMYGWKAQEVLGRPGREILSSEFVGLERSQVIQNLRETGEFRGEIVHYRKDGTPIYVESTAIVLKNGDDKITGYVTINRDITERKQAEEKLQKTLAELERSNKELEQFAYVASHDLQEPLRMVASYVQLLARRYKGKLDADADDFIAYAVDGAGHLQRMINDLLAYSRVGTRGKPFQPTDCQAVLNQVLANLKVAIEESSAVITQDPLPMVMADESQMTQLFQNLINNAIKFRGKASPRVHISVEPKETEWVFSVRDNGIGIDPQYYERIFMLFQSLHSREEYPGTGMGLAICKKIVERHGGRIWVESEPGKGSTFYFTISKRGGEKL